MTLFRDAYVRAEVQEGLSLEKDMLGIEDIYPWHHQSPQEIPELPDDCEGVEELREILAARTVSSLVRAAFLANAWAKGWCYSWYGVKDFLLKEIVLRAIVAPEEEILAWGLGQDEWGGDVLYIDLPGFPQVSFHVFWDDGKNVEGIVWSLVPQYPFEWTDERNETYEFCPIALDVMGQSSKKKFLVGRSIICSRERVGILPLLGRARQEKQRLWR
jgi:hypothetical protein